ncbi:MAG: VOC family protein [Phycisphaeraceae bacterium]|nr:MAG: VOC family protein [Phycisphaeraceae bacterium]
MPSPIGYDGGLTCSIHVTDLDRSLRWYQEVLGFTLLYKIDELAWAELATEVARVNIGLGQTEGFKAGPGIKLTFGVKNVDAARAFLESKDVRFDGPTQEHPGMVKLATFYDPDGNALMFYEDLSEGAGGAS